MTRPREAGKERAEWFDPRRNHPDSLMSRRPELLLRRGLVIGSGHQAVADIRIVDGRIAEVGIDLPGDTLIEDVECRGCGGGACLVDLHTHLGLCS